MTFCVYPSPEQIKAGNDVANQLYDALVTKALDGKVEIDGPYVQLINGYLKGKIDSVTAIFMAMNELYP